MNSNNNSFFFHSYGNSLLFQLSTISLYVPSYNLFSPTLMNLEGILSTPGAFFFYLLHFLFLYFFSVGAEVVRDLKLIVSVLHVEHYLCLVAGVITVSFQNTVVILTYQDGKWMKIGRQGNIVTTKYIPFN